MIILLAGEIAARRASGEDDKVGPGDDHGRVADHALAITNGDEVEADKLIAWLETRTAGLIKTHWKAVNALAAALLRQKKLSGSRVMEIVSEAHRVAGQAMTDAGTIGRHPKAVKRSTLGRRVDR